ncbi:MAG: TraR/DksA C4-type zinc finger protein [Candidatus Sungbacteria bacterium]|nr:TraR/DksA C4-type zinc finger protein [Candidatus Sungbacteria bacterium]
MEQAFLEELRHALEQERDKLAAELKSFARPDPKMAGDWDSQMPQFEPAEHGSHSSLEEEADEVEEYETRLATEHSLESRLLQVNQALTRMNAGTYGKCAKCGKEISPERLRANPAAEFDMEHS